MRRWPGIYLRGLAMGAADVVPGVSGGTMALITGIYAELINTLAGLSPRLIGIWRRDGLAAAWRAGNLSFLLVLLAGMLTSIVLLARGILWVMAHYPVPLWAFFCGLIIASILLVLRSLRAFGVLAWLMTLLGVLIAAWVSTRPGLDSFGLTPLIFFVSGAIAITAMILPGISGSFILLLLGMYAPVLAAVSDGDLVLLAAFAAGCATGLLAFVHLLRWALQRFNDAVMALLAGFMAGSLVRLWPWRIPAEPGATLELTVLPARYTEVTGLPAMVPAALLGLLGGVCLVWLVSRYGRHNEANPAVGTRTP
ncbi:DUF368 domain-containing protein [Alcanivorax sp. JB21]|uniref:DUF368 domain-containing protein n=1 Tax=Alcanivorax limicola TaxID=2874102 RepID=UPI001CBD537E|nr:DUF368 domain-containing protein [Alcanivorax limicola]MBZ2188378.1 DUF368 domain-containing protein [Alcanivorax limicola]